MMFWLSVAIWSVLALLFGVGPLLYGVHHFDTPGGLLMLLVGAVITAGCYGLHWLTCRYVIKRRPPRASL